MDPGPPDWHPAHTGNKDVTSGHGSPWELGCEKTWDPPMGAIREAGPAFGH